MSFLPGTAKPAGPVISTAPHPAPAPRRVPAPAVPPPPPVPPAARAAAPPTSTSHGLVSFLPGAPIVTTPVAPRPAPPPPAPTLQAPPPAPPRGSTSHGLVSFLPGAPVVTAPAAPATPAPANATPPRALAPGGLVSFLPPPAPAAPQTAPSPAADPGTANGLSHRVMALLAACFLALAGLAAWLWRRRQLAQTPQAPSPSIGHKLAAQPHATAADEPAGDEAPSDLPHGSAEAGTLASAEAGALASADPAMAEALPAPANGAATSVAARPRFVPIQFPDDEPAPPRRGRRRPPAPLRLDLEPAHMALTLWELVLHYRLRLVNRGAKDLGPLIIRADMVAADATISPRRAFLDAEPEQLNVRHRLEWLAAGGTTELRGELHLQLSNFKVSRLGRSSLCVPLVLIRAESTTETKPMRAAASFIIGSPSTVAEGGVQPFSLDSGTGVWRHLAARQVEFSDF